MIQSQRDVVILDLLREQGVVTVREICAACSCSPETARRDLRRLEEQGELLRTHGGAKQLAPGTPERRPANGTALLEARIALTDRVDALVVTPGGIKATSLLVDRCRRAGKPVVAEATTLRGATTMVAVDNYRAGLALGRRVAQQAGCQDNGRIVILDVSYPQANTELRSRGFADGLASLDQSRVTLVRVNGLGVRESARQIAADALAVHPDVSVIFGVNDDSALGALDAFRGAGLDEDRLLLATFGLEGDAAKRLLHDGCPYGIGVAMFPEVAGRACVDAAVCAYHGAKLPEHITTPFAIVTPDTLANFYQRDARTGRWLLNWEQVERLATLSPALRQVKDCHHRRRPRRIGYVETFSSHEWYRNIRLAMQERSRHLGVYLEVVDASEDLAFEIDAAKRAIGTAAARHVRDGDTIILDAGATTAYLAQALQGRQGVTVITNSLRVLAQLRDEHSITLVSSGGVVRRESQALTGRAAEATFQDLRVDKAFLSAAGISLDFGFSSTNIPEATVKQSMLAAAREVILVADSTKIGTESLVKVAPLARVHRLVTDPGISAEDRLALSQRGVEVTIAGDATLAYPAAAGNGLVDRAPLPAFLEEV